MADKDKGKGKGKSKETAGPKAADRGPLEAGV